MVVIPTLGARQAQLRRCLAGVAAQTRPPDELIVVRDRAGPVQALRSAWERTSCEWIAVLDDDAVPQTDWLARIESHLGDPALGAVGGRILNILDGRTTARTFERGPVASLSWYGRTISRLHDLPAAPLVCDVDFLPGSNMCIRRSALGELDARLDCGMAPGFELAVCQRLKRRGYRVRYDSEILVTHYPARRPERLRRDDRVRATREYSRTLVVGLLGELSWPRRLAFLAYFTLVGQRASPGLLAAPWFFLPGRSRARFRAALRGKLDGLMACASRS